MNAQAEEDRTYDVETPHLEYVTPPIDVTRTMDGRAAIHVIGGPTLVLSKKHTDQLIGRLRDCSYSTP